MAGMDRYMNAYLDRRMKYLIQDWDLATKNDLGDFESRLSSVEETIREIESFESGAGERLDRLEQRLQRMREGRR